MLTEIFIIGKWIVIDRSIVWLYQFNGIDVIFSWDLANSISNV